jgi:hypothetical protein
MANASIVYLYIDAAKPLYSSIPQVLDLIIMAHVTNIRQYPAFIVFPSQYPISFVQVDLGMPTDSDIAAAGKKRIGKPESYPTGATRNHNTFHLFLI